MLIKIHHYLNGTKVAATSHRVTTGNGLVRCINRTRGSGTHRGMRLSANCARLPDVSELSDGIIQLPAGSIYVMGEQ